MKKLHILTVSILIVSGSNFIVNATTENTVTENTEIKSTESPKTEIFSISSKVYELDELDDLSQQAEDNGIKIEAPSKPTYLMNLVRQFGLIFFLKPYIFVVENYRITRNFIMKYATMAWQRIFGKEPETVGNEKKRE